MTEEKKEDWSTKEHMEIDLKNALKLLKCIDCINCIDNGESLHFNRCKALGGVCVDCYPLACEEKHYIKKP